MSEFKKIGLYLDGVQRKVFSRNTTQKLAMQAKDIIFKRVKTGFGVNEDGAPPERTSRQKLKKLSPKYKQRRKKTGVSGEFGSPDFSNLTYSGEMLKSISVSSTKTDFTLEIPSTSRRDGKNNKDIAKWVAEQGRPFFSITRDEIKILESTVRELVRSSIKNAL